MSDQVVMSKNNGELLVAIPLYRGHESQTLCNLQGYTVALFTDKPIAYAVEHPEIGVKLFNAEFVENNLEFLGEL